MISMIKLRIDAFKELTSEVKDNELAKKMNISTTQLWRVRLPDKDPRHNDPGQDFVERIRKYKFSGYPFTCEVGMIEMWKIIF